MKRPLLLTLLALAVVGGIATWIILGRNGSNPTTTSATSVRMKWFFAGTMAPWFAGKEQGFFKDAGFELTINPGGPDNNAVKLVAAGTDAFGVAGADEVLLAREQGIPVVAVAVLFKDTPICFIAKADSGITSPPQWKGKTVEVSHGSNAEVQYRALVRKFDVTDVHEVPYTFSLAPFIAGKVDVSVAYRMDQVVTLQREGVSLNIMSPKEYGINPYGDVIITTEEMLRSHPERVRAFVEAVRRSFQWSIDHPEQAVASLVASAPALNSENELAVWKATIPFVLGEDTPQDIGVMRDARWSDTLQPLVELGLLKGMPTLKDCYRNVLQP